MTDGDPSTSPAAGTESGGTEPGEAGGLREVYRAQLLAGLGGWSGTVIAAIPTVVFVAVNALAGLRPGILAAVGASLLLAGYRLARRKSVQQALSGLFGVAIAAFIAYRTGQARGYFLFGILTSFGYAGVFVVSLVVRRPLVGLIWEFLDPSPRRTTPDGEPIPWHRNRLLLRAYDLATGLAALIFLARGLVQYALFKHNSTGWLAAARIAMGYPLTIAAVGFGFWAVNRARRQVAATDELNRSDPAEGIEDPERRDATDRPDPEIDSFS
jgi:hypothetical protein